MAPGRRATRPQRETERDPAPRLNDPKSPDETREAVQESERLREEGQAAIDETQGAAVS